MKLYYRISDKSYEKQKLLGATKEVCLTNFCRVFEKIIFENVENPNVIPPIRIIADRCSRDTLKMLRSTGIPLIITDYGNAGSLRYALDLAIKENQDDELVYFCEDDYLHLDNAPIFLQEGIKRADYVTLYDHPDKYTSMYDGGEISKVIKTTSSHWRYTASTCMTFGTKVKTLKDDMEIWNEFISGDHPHDHFIFRKLSEEKKRRLIVCIPGVACHTDLTFSGRVHHVLIDPWAIEMMIHQREHDIEQCSFSKSESFQQLKESMIKERTGWNRLVALDALFKQYSVQDSIDNKMSIS